MRMDMPVTLGMWLLTLLPIAALIVLMVGFHWGTARAAVFSLTVTAVTGVVFYQADLVLLAAEAAKGIWNALTIILVVWTAILLYQVGKKARAFLVIRNGMQAILPNELLQVLAIGWVFVSFLQGITGFGVPVAIGAPLLIGIGVAPVWAVMIPLLGQAWGNTFGTLAAAWDSLAMACGLSAGSALYLETALWTAVFLWFFDIMTGIAICWFYGRGRAVRKGIPAVLILSAVQGGGELLLSQINTTLCCFVPSLLALAVLILIGKRQKTPWSMEDSPIMQRQDARADGEQAPAGMSMPKALAPYVLLSVLTLVVLAIQPVQQYLGRFSVGFPFPETKTGLGYVNAAVECYSPLSIFTHASMFLLISALTALVYYIRSGWIAPGESREIFSDSISMTLPSAAAIVCLLVMSRIMGGTGQTVVLASGISRVLGMGYTVLSPFIGILGTFITGSNMSSNILFGNFQLEVAELLGIRAAAVLAAQTAGGAIGAAFSPSKIILGTSTVGLLGREGDVMRRLLPLGCCAALVIGGAVFAFAR